MKTKVKKVKLAFIEDKKAREATSKRRTNAVMKKLGEMMKLCNVKACLIFFLRPSREGTEELCAKFLNLSLSQTRELVNQMITKPDEEDGEENLSKKAESSASCFPPPPPVVHQAWYNHRNRGESSASSLPRRPDYFETWYNNKMQSERLYEYQAQRLYAFNMTHNLSQNLNLNQNLYLNQNQNLNQNQREPFKVNYQSLYDFYDGIPQMLAAFNKKHNINVHHNLVPYNKYTGPETDSSLNENEDSMDTSEEQMDESEDEGNTPYMDGSSSAQPIIID